MSRYVLIDYMHLAYKCMVAEPLSATVNIGGEPRVVDTTIPNYTIKNVFNYGGRGSFHTGVFFEGGNSKRKAYFAQQTAGQDGSSYKGGRKRQRGSFYEGCNLALNLMHNGKVSLYRMEGQEADDLIVSLVQKIKSVDPITPIDIITGDSDLLPLVDEQVSVYMRSTRQHAEPGCPERRLYYQVTPDTWYDYLSYSSAYRKFHIPYNSMLLFKLIRGDKSDEIPASTKGYGGVKYSNLMEEMVEDEVDFPNIFRYGVDFDEVMRPVLEDYFDEATVEHMKFVYTGINPEYVNLDIPKQIEPGYLQAALNPVQINILR